MWIEKIQQMSEITLTNPQIYSILFSEKKIIQTKIPIQPMIYAYQSVDYLYIDSLQQL